MGVSLGAIEQFASALQQRFGRAQTDAQVADAFQRQRVVNGFFDARIDPRPGTGPDEMQRILIGRPGDAGVDGRMKNLRQRPDRGRALEGALETNTSSNTTEPLPVVRWPKPVQSSITVSPTLSRGTKASCCTPCSSTTEVGMRWAYSEPVE